MAFTRSQIEAMKEDGLRPLVIRPLLKKMGFHDVRHNHGSHELGKDFVMWQLGDIGARENWAVVAKAGPISGKTSGRNSAAEVVSQIRRALSTTFHDSETNAPCQVNRCYVIASGTISEPARTAIGAELTDEQKSAVKYMDGDRLWEYVQKHLPASAVLNDLVEAGRELDALNPNWRIVPRTRGESTEFTLEPKHPDAQRIDPLRLEGRFVFPDTAEGGDAKRAFLHHIETGAPLAIKRPFIEGFQFPEWLREYVDPAGEGPAELRLGPRKGPKPATLRLVLEPDSGETYAHERVRFKVLRHGTKEFALESDEPGLPWSLGLVFNLETRDMELSYRARYLGANVKPAYEGKRFELGLVKGGKLSVHDAERGLFLFSGLLPPGADLHVDDWIVAFAERLALIQAKTGIALHMPEKFEDEDVTLVEAVSKVVRNGHYMLHPRTITLRRDRPEMKRILAQFGEQPEGYFRFVDEQEAEIFGAHVPLGRAVRIIVGYRPSPESVADVQAKLAQDDGDGPLDLQFTATDGAGIQQIYERWLSAEDRASLPNDLFGAA
jgi:hypothetical protein